MAELSFELMEQQSLKIKLIMVICILFFGTTKIAFSQEANFCELLNLKNIVLADKEKYGVASNRSKVEVHLSNLAKAILNSKSFNALEDCKATYIKTDTVKIYFQYETSDKMKYEMQVFTESGELQKLCINRNNISVEAPHPADRNFPHIEKPLLANGWPDVPPVYYLALCFSADGIKQGYMDIR